MGVSMASSCSRATSLLLLLFSFSFSLSLLFSSATSTDTISAQHSLSGNQTITSRGSTFVLGFFTPPGSTGTTPFNYYIGIWYSEISVLTPVWVANRVTPVTEPTASELKISNDGNLVLLDQFKSIIWSTNVTAISSSNSTTVAVILDTGNLQLRDESNSSLVFWQSFDHPIGTLLPGAKFGINKITKRSQRLTSWKSKVDPAPGIFSFEMDQGGSFQYFCFWNSSRTYCSTGLWDGRLFTQMTELPPVYIVSFQVVNETDENYFTYTVIDPNHLTSRYVIDSEYGQIQLLTWMENSNSWQLIWARPRSKCSVYGVCGPFGSCHDLPTPFCTCVKGFRIKSQTDWSLGDRSQGCERVASLQCSGQNNSEEDGFFKMENVRLPDNSLSLAMLGSSQDCEQTCLSNFSCNAYSFNSTGCFVWHGELLNLQEELNRPDAGILYLRLAASEFQTFESNKMRMVAHISLGVVAAVVCLFMIGGLVWKRERRRRATQNSKVVQNSLVSFMYDDELRIATKNFSEKLGGGGFGSVFKGSLPGSINIAVKKLEGLYQGEKQFRAEVSTLGVIQHVNLIRLIGFCSQGTKKLLVYEFMPCGSLADQLFRSNSNVLDWKTRYRITTKVDVYSYGMMLFEIISGKRNLVCATDSCFEFFPTVAASKLINGDIEGLLDHRFEGEADLGELEVACKLAGWCIQDDESSRPTMSRVVQALEGNLDINIPPIPKFLQRLSDSCADNINSAGNFSSNQNSNSRASSTEINNATT